MKKVRLREDWSEEDLVAYACGPLKKPRYINQKIERELEDFKKEVEGKFNRSPIRDYSFPKKSERKSKYDLEEDNYCFDQVLQQEEINLPHVPVGATITGRDFNYSHLKHAKKYIENANVTNFVRRKNEGVKMESGGIRVAHSKNHHNPVM